MARDSMDDDSGLSEAFEADRSRLRAMAYRMLGSPDDADDALQEAWIRAQRSDRTEVTNLPGWLTTVVARICLDALRSRAARRAETRDMSTFEGADHSTPDPEGQAELADAVSESLMVVLGELRPAERLAFVLHDLFAVPFEDIGPVLSRSPAAAKQLASRARIRVRGGEAVAALPSPDEQRRVVDAFLAAARGGDLDRLVTLLHPDVEIDADAASVRMGSPARTVGVDAVAATFNGRALGATAAVIDGAVGFLWIVNDQVKVVWEVEVVDGMIRHIEMLADPAVLGGLAVEHLDARA
jgi:RNA polymerase sigma-70 factor (ECF subfamily)